MNHSAFRRYVVLSILAGIIALVLVNAAVRMTGVQADLTQHGRHSVNPGAARIADQLMAPVRLTYYVSASRPPALARLEEGIVAQLELLGRSGSRGMILFAAASDVVRVQHDQATLRNLAERGIRPQSYGGWPLVSTLVLEHPLWLRPKVIELPAAATLQYDVVSLLARLTHRRPQPAVAEEALRALEGSWTLTYLWGEAGKPAEMPVARRSLRQGVEDVLAWVNRVNTGIQTRSESVAVSELRNLGVSGEPVMETVAGSSGGEFGSLPESLRYWSTLVIEAPNRRRTTLQGIRSPEGLQDRIAQSMWALAQGQSEIGVFMPDRRPEYGSTLLKTYSMGQGQPQMPERRVLGLIRQLDFEAREVRITPNEGIPDLACLVIVRPSYLSLRQAYEIQAWLAGGGRVITFVGNAHVDLVDRGLQMNEAPTSSEDLWRAGTATGFLKVQPTPGVWKEWLSVNGVEAEEGLLMAQRSVIPYRVYSPKPITPELRFGRPNVQAGTGPLQPFAWPVDGGHALAANVDALNLRGGTTLKTNQETISRLGLAYESFLQAPHDAIRLPVPEGGAEFPYADTSLQQELLARAEPVGPNSSVGLIVQGRFPFDPSKAPPPFERNDRPWLAPGASFLAGEGVLAVVAAPDLFEGIDETGINEFRATLVGGGDGLAQTSARRLLGNLLDGLVLGEDLIEVRRSLLPPSRRVIPWTERERRVWTVVVVGFPPMLCFLIGATVIGRRAARRRKLNVGRNQR